jgi:hypothetical protein
MHLVMLVMVMVMMHSVHITAIILWKGANADRLNG